MASKSKKTKPKVVVDPHEFLEENLDDEMPNDLDFEALEKVIEEIDDLPVFVKALIYGHQGSGKTTFGGTGPVPVIFLDCNERGTLSVRGQGHKRVRITNLDQLQTIFWYLYAGKHQFKTVVLDTTTMMADIVMSQVLKDDGHEGPPHKNHWGDSTAIQRDLLLKFRNLPMNVIFLAQLKRLNEDDLSDEEEKSRVPLMSPAVREMLCAAVDVIGYTYVKEVEKEIKGKLKTQYQYRMRIGPSSTFLTKIRTKREVKYPAVLVDPTFNKVRDILLKEE